MPNPQAVATELLATDTTLDSSSPAPAASAVATVSGNIRKIGRPAALGRNAALSSLTDRQLGYVLSAILFVFAAWPLALTEVPPFQDLPNHLAAVTVIEHPELYPEFAFNGFLKTNAALFAWLFVVGKVTGLKIAARLFAAGVLAANAVVIPRFVLTLTGSRGKMIVATLLSWAMIHNWFVSMGMLDFALGVPLSLALLLALDRHRRDPSIRNAGFVVGLGLVTWYAHVFPLLVVHMLVGIEVLRRSTWRERIATTRAVALPLLPVTLLAIVSFASHLRDAVGPMTGFVDYQRFLPPWELAYNMWAEWHWSFTHLTLTSLVPCLVLAVVGLWRRRESVTFFSPLALLALGVLYCALPYIITNWYHVNSRIIPYLWIAFLVRVPARLPRPLVLALGASAAVYTVGMGVDYARLERERQEFTAGINAVPEGARLLPLLFKQKGESKNTHNLLHAWGYYVSEKKTAAPLLFAHSHSFPVMYSVAPPVRFNHLVLEGFAPSAATPEKMCRSMFDGNLVVDDCDQLFRRTWAEFYSDATPRFDHLLIWDATPEALAVIPSDYHRTFHQGRLAIYARNDVKPLASR